MSHSDSRLAKNRPAVPSLSSSSSSSATVVRATADKTIASLWFMGFKCACLRGDLVEFPEAALKVVLLA
eukprot:1570997-Alexandrium_andersonii.AAC.1